MLLGEELADMPVLNLATHVRQLAGREFPILLVSQMQSRRGLRRSRQRDAHGEAAACSLLALHQNLPFHALHQILDNRHAKPRTFDLTGGLAMSRIDSGRIILNEENFSLADLIHDISVIVRPQAAQKNQTLRIFKCCHILFLRCCRIHAAFRAFHTVLHTSSICHIRKPLESRKRNFQCRYL